MLLNESVNGTINVSVDFIISVEYDRIILTGTKI